MAGRNLFHRALYAAVSFILFLSGDLTSFSQETSRAALPETEIRALANRVLQKTGKVDCKPGNCTILVANFTLPSGATSRLGMQIADQVSKELASQQNAIKIVDRSRLQTFLDEGRIPAALFNNEKAICWLGKQMGATTLLRGTTENRGGPGPLRVQASLLSCVKDKAGPVEEFAFPDSDAESDLSPLEPFSKTLPALDSPSIPLVSSAGADGISSPSCLYCPNPNYTDPARAAKFNGTVIMAVTVSPLGRTIEARVARGAPYGVNDTALKAVRDWQFKPAMREGAPVACTVMIEATFRLY
jgi:TonB family protein